jgi:hypothetical protein
MDKQAHLHKNAAKNENQVCDGALILGKLHKSSKLFFLLEHLVKTEGAHSDNACPRKDHKDQAASRKFHG